MRHWKQAERRIAAILGGRRIPVSGRGRGDNPDIEHPALSVEVKTRASFPAWLEDALKQAELAARDGKTPAVVLHQDRRKYPDALVVACGSRSSRSWSGPAPIPHNLSNPAGLA